ncbi:MAG: hypothetical protein JWQ27_1638 [Ferruginibacter sp.]|nr:hypothetical protein [Ferruginibacter sp.]
MKYAQSFALTLLTAFSLFSCKPNNTETATTTTNANVVKVPVISAADNKYIIDRERSTWEFAKLKNLAAMREILADDYIGFFGKNIVHPNESVQMFQQSTVNSYRMYNIRVKTVTEDVAIIYYELQQDILDQNGVPWTPNVAASSTYVKRNGKWYSVFYQETVINN